jgi:hypothetical protein
LVIALLAAGCGGEEYVIDGPPEFEVGTGQYAFEAVSVDQELPIVHGPQGGDHVWLGVRVANMYPKGFHLESSMVRVEDEQSVGFSLFFDVDLFIGPSGDLEYAGLPLQLEPNEVDGMAIRATIVATDRDGRTMTSSMEIVPRRQ